MNLIRENHKILEEEELYWFQRSHETWLLKGDYNSDFSHEVANGKKRGKNTIYNLEDNGCQHLRKIISRMFESSLVGFGSLDNNLIK